MKTKGKAVRFIACLKAKAASRQNESGDESPHSKGAAMERAAHTLRLLHLQQASFVAADNQPRADDQGTGAQGAAGVDLAQLFAVGRGDPPDRAAAGSQKDLVAGQVRRPASGP